jgi:hypothetical protein
MVFWGRDVVHEHGNLLLAQGFTKARSAGLQSSSCYGLPWENGRIELHGASAGWFPDDGSEGFLFIRPSGRCHVWKGGAAPVPGEWPHHLLHSVDASRVLDRVPPFLRWWLGSERWIAGRCGPAYRSACHRHLKRLPQGRPWLAPAIATKWLEQLLVDPASVPRAKRYHP